MRSNIQGRLERIQAAYVKTEQRLGEMDLLHRQSARGKRLKSKLAEYRESLENLRQFGQETSPNGLPAGVEINIPAQGGR